MKNTFQIYLVGGAVRDQLLGRSVTEKDWVVVGATPQMMLDLGYRPVGKDFPVFLHPETHEEYALARTERKTGPGYKGFVFHTAPDVTLEEDLKRRDLTINAIAQDVKGHIIDPYHGQQDLEHKIFRHVSAAFSEDPVRILRVARFAARFQDFMVHPETETLMRQIVDQGELNALVPERVWQEWEKGLAEAAPHRFFEILRDCGAFNSLFPMLKHHPEGFEALNRAVNISPLTSVRLATLCYSLSRETIRGLAECYRLPNDHAALAKVVAEHHADYLKIPERDAKGLLDLLKALDALRQKTRFQHFLLACEIIYPESKENSRRLLQALALAESVRAEPFVAQGLSGKAIGEAMYEAQMAVIEEGLESPLR